MPETSSAPESPEYRASTGALKADGRTVSGYVCVWDVPYAIPGGLEVMARDSVMLDDLELTLGHDLIDAQGHRMQGGDAPVLASVRAGTMTATSDDKGLYVEAPDLDASDPDVQSALAKLKRGDVRGLSVGMYVLKDSKANGVRTVSSARAFQAALVGRPANPAAEAELRAAQGETPATGLMPVVLITDTTPPAPPTVAERLAASPTPTVRPAPIPASVPADAEPTARPTERNMRMSAGLITALRDKREALAISIDATIKAQTEGAEVRSLTAEEDVSLKNEQRQLAILDERITELTDAEVRAAASRKVAAEQFGLDASGIKVVSEVATYRKGGPNSYFADIARQATNTDPMASERLHRHAAEMRDLSRTDGAGGFFVPPVWLVAEYAPFLRAGRVISNLVNSRPLPAGTDSLNIPRITTGTSVSTQADNGAVSETDMVDAAIAVPVRTLAGQQSLSLQLIEQSAVAFDEIVMQDLTSELGRQINLGVLSGAGTGVTLKGITTSTPAGNQVTYVDASPTVGELYSKVADAIQRITTARFLPPTAIVMHPRRWAWILAAVDSSQRPLVVPDGNAFNPAAVSAGAMGMGYVGRLQGLPVYVDPTISIVQGAGTEDSIIIGRFEDAWLFEGSLRTRALPQPKAGTLEVLIQAYEYLAFTAERYAVAFATITGTGLIAPTF